MPQRRARMPMPRVWSPWSCVTSSASMESGATSREARRRSRSRPLKPASTSRRVRADSTRMEFPELPLPSTVTLTPLLPPRRGAGFPRGAAPLVGARELLPRRGGERHPTAGHRALGDLQEAVRAVLGQLLAAPPAEGGDVLGREGGPPVVAPCGDH